MSDLVDRIKREIYARDHIPCPHCSVEIDMTDPERARDHVTYWGDDGPKEDNCPHCDKSIWLQEHVQRSWTVGTTPDEAGEP